MEKGLQIAALQSLTSSEDQISEQVDSQEGEQLRLYSLKKQTENNIGTSPKLKRIVYYGSSCFFNFLRSLLASYLMLKVQGFFYAYALGKRIKD
ncbi:hypothetical protein [Chlamydia avium]|uniref:Uncharacterized protein n=1 Tax=Chlamydia avium 10DC88 TaxID=1229831 RepID=W8JGV7_9CHLA|nr:hypothetical protein [Chlamydia avium]AHK63435.1 Uncharacterized protein M832_05720 [Chlamydia avium 10DC88]